MQTWVILLRGINVGGKNMLPMARLTSLCQSMGFENVKHYLQSGNLVAQSGKNIVTANVSAELCSNVAKEFGFKPHIQIISGDNFLAAANANPFKDLVLVEDGKAVHLYFLDAKPAKSDDKLNALKAEGESWKLVGHVFYLHVSNDFHKSKLAQRAEKILGVNATARNWRTVSKIVEMLK